jgi:hypothetical protein
LSVRALAASNAGIRGHATAACAGLAAVERERFQAALCRRALVSSMSSTLGLRCCWSSEAGVLGATGAGRAAAMDVWAAVDRRRRAKRGRSLMGLTSPVGADVSEAAAVADRLWLAEVASP